MKITGALEKLRNMIINVSVRDFFTGVDTSRTKMVMDLKNSRTRTEYLQDWGFISVPPEGTGKCIVIQPGGNKTNGVIVKADKPETRPEGFEAGDCGLFNDSGVVIKLSGKTVTITGADNIDLGDTTTKLVNDSFLQLYNQHTHLDPVSGSTSVPVVPSSEIHLTKKVGAE